jgi:hypothetical protein
MVLFTELVKKHFKYNSAQELKNHISFELIYYINDLNFTNILPGTVLLGKHIDNNVAYHGKECTMYGVWVYKYDNYYIVFTYDTEGEDLDVDKVENISKCPIEFYKKTSNVYKKSEITPEKIMNIYSHEFHINCSNNLNFIMDIFNGMCEVNGKKRFIKYMLNLFDKKKFHVKK